MKKQFMRYLDGNFNLIGRAFDGRLYWLRQGKFDWDWHWRLGYLANFNDSNVPAKTGDVVNYIQFNKLFLNGSNNLYDTFNKFFTETVFETEQETWEFLDRIETLYTCKKYAEVLRRGGSEYCYKDEQAVILKNIKEMRRLNDDVIPTLLNQLTKLLEG